MQSLILACNSALLPVTVITKELESDTKISHLRQSFTSCDLIIVLQSVLELIDF